VLTQTPGLQGVTAGRVLLIRVWQTCSEVDRYGERVRFPCAGPAKPCLPWCRRRATDGKR
jgi:hypothetical protein